MSNLTLNAINIYPIKSMGGIPLNTAQVEVRGFEYDRRWMLVDEQGRLLTQRELPTMALISISLEEEGLKAEADGMQPLFIPFHQEPPASITVQVWRSTCQAEVMDDNINKWFSSLLNTPCRLVYMPDTTRRNVNPDYAINNDIVSFADGYPFMILSEASLADLNSRLANPLPMNRFRPNLVVSGAAPYDEDDWQKIAIGSTIFHGVKGCDRCSVTTIDQTTAVVGKEPLKTLATYRQIDNKVYLGQYLIPDNPGETLTVGDTLEIIE